MYLNPCQGDRKVIFSFCSTGVSHEGMLHCPMCAWSPFQGTLSQDTGTRDLSFKRAMRRAREDTFALVLKSSSASLHYPPALCPLPTQSVTHSFAELQKLGLISPCLAPALAACAQAVPGWATSFERWFHYRSSVFLPSCISQLSSPLMRAP